MVVQNPKTIAPNCVTCVVCERDVEIERYYGHKFYGPWMKGAQFGNRYPRQFVYIRIRHIQRLHVLSYIVRVKIWISVMSKSMVFFCFILQFLRVSVYRVVSALIIYVFCSSSNSSRSFSFIEIIVLSKYCFNSKD